MSKILSGLKHFGETLFIYTYFIVGMFFALIACAIFNLIPKKNHENFTPDGYDL